MAVTPVFSDFDFRAHLARLARVADLTQGSCRDDRELYLDGMQVLYDAWAAVGTTLNIPTRSQKDATLAISAQVVMALTSAGVLVMSGDYQRVMVTNHSRVTRAPAEPRQASDPLGRLNRDPGPMMPPSIDWP